MITCKRWMSGVALVVATALTAAAQAPAQQPAPTNVDEYVRLIRDGVQKEKIQIITAALELDAAQSAAFWPVYKQFEAELAPIGDRRYAGIKEYAANYGSLTDAKATELITFALGLEEQRLAVVRKYITEFGKVLPGVKVARWYQAEMGLNRIVDVRLAAELPLAR